MAKQKRGNTPARREAGAKSRGLVDQELVNEAVQMLEEGQFIEAVMLLEEARQEHPKDPIPVKLLGMAYSQIGMVGEAIDRWEEATRLDPDDPHLWRLLAGIYAERGYYTHALRALRRFGTMTPEDEIEDPAGFAVARQELEELLQATGRDLGVSASEVERGTLLFERAQRALEQRDYVNALRHARDAGRVLPHWPPVQNTVALAQFESGKGADAIATLGRVLAAQPDDMTALAQLTRFQLTLGRRDEARASAERLWELAQPTLTTPSDDVAEHFQIEKAAEAFTLFEQDERVIAVLERIPREAMTDFGLFLLGTALANVRRKDAALAIFASLEPQPQAARFAEALRLNETPPGGRFIPLSPVELLPGGMMDALLARLPDELGGTEDERAALQAAVAEAPTFLPACYATLWLGDEEGAAQAIDVLLALGTPPAVEAVRTLAFGRLGPDDIRLYAALALRRAGHVDANQRLLLWQDGRYQELYLPRYELTAGAASATPYAPALRKLMTRALERYEDGDLDGATRLYRQALAQDPTVVEAEQHLGLIALMQGDRDGAEPHFLRAFELNPEFGLARTALASVRISQRRLSEARDLLAPLTGQTTFSPHELASYLFTTAELAAADGDTARARTQLRLLLAHLPTHAPARLRLRNLEQQEAERQQEQTKNAMSVLQPPGGAAGTGGIDWLPLKR